MAKQQRTILVVDDSPSSNSLIKLSLERYGFKVDILTDGLSALERMAHTPPDVAILDYFLPKIDGGRVAHYIRRTEHSRKTKIIILSGAIESIPPQETLDADAIIAKNKFEILEKNLLKTIENLLNPQTKQTLPKKTIGLEGMPKRSINDKIHNLKQHITRLYEALGEAVFETNEEGKVINLNSTALALLGQPEELVVGRSLINVLQLSETNPLVGAIDEILQGSSERVDNIEISIRQRMFTCIVSKLEMMDSTFHLLIVAEDVTERFEAEAEKAKILEQLYQSQKLDAIGVLAGGIAHDMNNFLTGIVGNLALAKLDLESTSPILECLSDAEHTAMLARNLTRQLLTFSKGGAPIREPIAILDVLKASIQFALRGSNVEAHFALPEDLWHVNADEAQISQVISNVVINAKQAMPQGGSLKVSAKNASAPADKLAVLADGRYVQLDIADGGCGIAEENLAKIFEPYFSTKETGSGLGLAVSYSIVARHDGCIDVDSKPGQGSVFSIWLPAVEGKALQPKAQEQAEPKNLLGKILLMDDQELILKSIGAILQKTGHQVATAGDGEEAIRLYREALEKNTRYEVVILDLTVPGGMGGEETIKELLKIDPGVKAIASSGYSDSPIMAEYKDYGFLGVVVKPYEVRRLSREITRLLQTPHTSPQ